LLKKEKVCWAIKEERAFQQLKAHLRISPFLPNPDFDCTFLVHMDASKTMSR
ncbi:Glyceraldehyde-3-phosphate dehydrogenase, partial [Clarias magur]